MQTRDDEELIRLHLRGDQEAFRHLVERYTRSIYNLAYRSTGDRAEAENITQDTFLLLPADAPGFGIPNAACLAAGRHGPVHLLRISWTYRTR